MIEDKSRMEALEKSLNLNEEEVQMETKLLDKAKNIYVRLEEFVKQNRSDNYKDYNGAYIKLAEGRKIFFPFDELNNQIKIWNYHWDDNRQRSYGDAFSILPVCDCGFLCNLQIFAFDKEKYELTVSEKKARNYHKLTEEQYQLFDNYLTKLAEALETMEYDNDSTYANNNLTIEAEAKNRARECNDEIKRVFGDVDPTTVVLPSVETAVDWWIESIKESSHGGGVGDDFNSRYAMQNAEIAFSQTAVSEMQISVFKDVLSKKIMDQLRRGLIAKIDYDFSSKSFLHDALEEANISDARLPYRTAMIVDAKTVKVRANGMEEEIYNSENVKGQHLH